MPKRDLVATLAVAMQQGRLKVAAVLPEAALLQEELQNFQVKMSVAGHDTYGAGDDWREGVNDDLVLAVGLALWVGEQAAAMPLLIEE